MRKKKRRKHYCALCGAHRSERPMTLHHVYHGKKYRDISDKEGFILTLCEECHRNVHSSRALDKLLQKSMQRAYEEKHSREEFLEIFGRSWLTPEDDLDYLLSLRMQGALHKAVMDMGLDKN